MAVSVDEDGMKPRLESLPWTYEDQQIWRLVGMMNPGGMNLRALYDCWTQSDRRDAELMWRAQRMRMGRWGPLVHWSPEQPDYTYEYIWFGGGVLGRKAIHEATAAYITYFA